MIKSGALGSAQHEPPPAVPCKIEDVVDQSAMRRPLSGSVRRSIASFIRLSTKDDVNARVNRREGLRRSWARIATNCRSLAASCASNRLRLARGASCASNGRHQLREVLEHADFCLFNLAGRGSIAHNVPKKAPFGRMIGIEM
jgi:hypothetical protein